MSRDHLREARLRVGIVDCSSRPRVPVGQYGSISAEEADWIDEFDRKLWGESVAARPQGLPPKEEA